MLPILQLELEIGAKKLQLGEDGLPDFTQNNESGRCQHLRWSALHQFIPKTSQQQQ